MLNKLRKARRLSAKEWRLLAQAFLLLPLTRYGVYVFGIKRWQRVLIKLATLRKTSGAVSGVADNVDEKSTVVLGAEKSVAKRADRIARIVRIAADHGFCHANCLQQTLVLWYLLRHHDIDSDICFGARKEDGELEAHAWIRIGDLVLSDDNGIHRGFLPFRDSLQPMII